MNSIKLTKTSNALRGVSSEYEYKDQIIHKDNCSGYWYCEPLFKGVQFNSLSDIRKALELSEKMGKRPSQYDLMINGISC